MSLKDVFEKNPDRRYIMFGGKGGLGKTTFSAATAYWLASQGKKVLVFSVDPQASLTDIFQRDIFGKCAVKILQYFAAAVPVVCSPVGTNLEVVEHGRSGYFAATEDEWVARLDELLGDAQRRWEFGQAGRDTVQRRYSIESTLYQVVKALVG